MPPQIFTFDAKAASSQDVEKVVDHNGRDQIRINDKATKLTLAISPSALFRLGEIARVNFVVRDAWKWDKMGKIQEAFGSVG